MNSQRGVERMHDGIWVLLHLKYLRIDTSGGGVNFGALFY